LRGRTSELEKGINMARDRTSEFIKTVESIKGKPQYMNQPELRARRKGRPGDGGPQGYNGYVDFMRRSREAARDLYKTYQKLEALNRLARKTTIFNWEEASKELNQLVGVIKEDIGCLNKQIEELRKEQVHGLQQKSSHNMESHSKTVVLSLQQQLATMSSSFKSTLELRSQNMQQQKQRREQFTGPESEALRPVGKQATVIDLDFGGGQSSGSSRADPRLRDNQQQQQQQQLLVYEDNATQYLEERASAMQSIESTIVELGTIFNQLATMVQQQEEMITRIDANVNDTSLNVEAAHESILRYFQSVTNNRWLMFKVFGVLFVFFLVFVMFAA
jgi:syntaxin 5